MTQLWTVFLTGLVTGGLSCLAVQGGLLAATIAQAEDDEIESGKRQSGNVLLIISFLVAKLVAYTALGFLLGWFGSLFSISLSVQVVMQFLVALFMIGTALNILDVHPMFRYFAIQPPRFITKMVRNKAKSKSIFTPALMGAFTVFIPCGTTQAMMVLAIGSGSPLMGALIMCAFVLGTSPLFFILGYSATRLGDVMQNSFMKVVAVALIILALFNLRNVLALSGTNFGFSRGASVNEKEAPISEATIEFLNTSYSPSRLTVKAGTQVTLNLVNDVGRGCVQAFTIPKLGIQQVVPLGGRETVTFTAPQEPQQLEFMCSMGMYRGVIDVI